MEGEKKPKSPELKGKIRSAIFCFLIFVIWISNLNASRLRFFTCLLFSKPVKIFLLVLCWGLNKVNCVHIESSMSFFIAASFCDYK